MARTLRYNRRVRYETDSGNDRAPNLVSGVKPAHQVMMARWSHNHRNAAQLNRKPYVIEGSFTRVELRGVLFSSLRETDQRRVSGSLLALTTGAQGACPMATQTIPPTPIECQTDAAAALRAARADARAARARQCRAQAWSIMFFVDACDDERAVAAWLAERAALIEEAERLEGGAS